MAFIRSKRKGSRTYYYLVESKREGNKVRQKVIKYFGVEMPTKEEWVSIPIPAIVPRDTFEQVQARFERNRAFAMRNTRREYLLSGLLVCSKCGRTYRGMTSRGRAYYECRSKRADISPELCPSCYLRGDRIEPLIWDTVSRLLSQPQLIIDQVENDGHKPLEHLKANLDRVGDTLAKKKIEADRMLEAYKVGAIDLPTLKRKMEEIGKDEVELNEQKLKLESELRKAEAEDLNEEKLYEFCRSLPTVLTGLNFKDKRQILREVIDKIVMNGDLATIYGIIPPPPQENSEDASIVFHSSY